MRALELIDWLSASRRRKPRPLAVFSDLHISPVYDQVSKVLGHSEIHGCPQSTPAPIPRTLIDGQGWSSGDEGSCNIPGKAVGLSSGSSISPVWPSMKPEVSIFRKDRRPEAHDVAIHFDVKWASRFRSILGANSEDKISICVDLNKLDGWSVL